MSHGWRLWLPTLVGLAIIAMTLRDVVHELFHPEDSGSLSRLVARGVWRALHVVAGGHRRRVLFNAGPLTLIAVALVWAALLVVGWALVFWPRLPGSFHSNPALTADQLRGFGTAVYVSMATMTTLSASDLTPATAAMRWAVTLESYIGPMLFTAWITWVLGSYPVLAERRALMHEVAILRKVHGTPVRAARDSPPEAAVAMLRSLAEQMLLATARLRQSRVTYYFQNEEPSLALAVQLPWVIALATAARDAARTPAVSHYGSVLHVVVCDLLDFVGEQFFGANGEPPRR